MRRPLPAGLMSKWGRRASRSYYTGSQAHGTETAPRVRVYMIYVINFLAVAAFPLAVAAYGGHLAAKVLSKPERHKALAVVWMLAIFGVLISGVQQVLIYRSHQAQAAQQTAFAEKDDQNQQQLRDELRSTLQREEYLRKELDDIAQFLRAPHPDMKMSGVAATASRMAEDAMRR